MRISDWSSDVCSSDLADWLLIRVSAKALCFCLGSARGIKPWALILKTKGFQIPLRRITLRFAKAIRSEEHTSELQSLMRISYAVFCLKKKNKTNRFTLTHNI